MNAAKSVPADTFIEQVLSALTRADAVALRQLESAATAVSEPLDRARYPQKRAALAAMLTLTARNLRFLHRIASKKPSGFSAPFPR